MGIRAFIFDCNGLLCDDEPFHFLGLQRALSEEGIALDQAEYLARYISYDDYGAIRHVLADRGRAADDALLNRVVTRKRHYYGRLVEKDLRMFPGAVDFVRAAARGYATALASGAIRPEIDRILVHGGIAECFEVIVSAEEVERPKPAPDSYLLALDRLNANPTRAGQPIRACECVVLEDSRGGVAAAREAGMHVVAVTNSHPPEDLSHAHHIITTLEGVSPVTLAAVFAGYVDRGAGTL